MDFTDKEFQWFMKEAKKDGIKLKTEEEYHQLQRDMYALADLTYDIWRFQKSLDHRLEQNPTLLNQKLTITPNEWLIPVAKSAKDIREQLEVVRTMPQQIQKASEEALMSKWCRV